MSATIDAKWLEEQGIDSESSNFEELVPIVTTEWEIRVGYKIAELLTDKQIGEFEKLESEDEQIAWLSEAYPQYPEIVLEVSEQLANELQSDDNKVSLIQSWKKKQVALGS